MPGLLEDEMPDWLDEDLPPDPEDLGVTYADEDFCALTPRAEAEGAADAVLRARLLAAGLGSGYAHVPGTPRVPGVHTGPGLGFGQGQAYDSAAPEPSLAALADDAAGTG